MADQMLKRLPREVKEHLLEDVQIPKGHSPEQPAVDDCSLSREVG